MLKDRKLAPGLTAFMAQWTNTVFALYSTGLGSTPVRAINFFNVFSSFFSVFCKLRLRLVLGLRLVLRLELKLTLGLSLVLDFGLRCV